MQLTLLSGVSGSGKSVALKALEDSGYFCVDNLPPNLIRGLVSYVAARGEPRVAVSADARSADTIGVLPQGFPPFTIPSIELSDAVTLVGGAMAIALIALASPA